MTKLDRAILLALSEAPAGLAVVELQAKVGRFRGSVYAALTKMRFQKRVTVIGLERRNSKKVVQVWGLR